jgi:DNA-binding response OmpR family regulator
MTRKIPAILIYRHPDGTEEHIQLDHDVTTLGRSDTCAVHIPLATVSRLHARIEQQHGRYVVFDIGSANGTFVNGKQIDQGYMLSTGDELWIGTREAVLSFTDPEQTLIAPGSGTAPTLAIDIEAHSVEVYGALVELSRLEYSLLLHLANNSGTVCSREGCFLAVWGKPYDHATCGDALNACVAKLRRNLRAATQAVGQEAPQITTIHGVGFRLDTDVIFVQHT